MTANDIENQDSTEDDNALVHLINSYVDAFEQGKFEQDGEYGWETWRWDYLNHFQSQIVEQYDLQNLTSEDIEPFLDSINEHRVKSQNITSMMIKRGSGWDALKTSLDRPEKAATTLSILFDNSRDIEERLEAFAEFYGDAILVQGSKGHFLSTPSLLLMYAYPEEYIFYKWREFRWFFEQYFNYTIQQGFNPEQYVEILGYCQTLQEHLREHLDDASMVHVQNLIWFQQHSYETSETTSNTDYYWVNQNDTTEIKGEYLDALVDDQWSHDLSVLEVGDTIFHYTDQEIIGDSTVVEAPYTINRDGDDRYRVEVDLNRYDNPRKFDDISEQLMQTDVRGEKYYPITKNGGIAQAYLCQLTEEAAEYLQNQRTDQHYFWLSANPSIWKGESSDDGDEVFYPAYNQKRNKRRLFSAFETAAQDDKVLCYESTPSKAIVAEGVITEGLHEAEHEAYDEPVDGITIEYTRPIEGITWEQLNAVPDLEEAAPIINQTQGSLFRLTAEEYDTILALEEPENKPAQAELDTLREKLDPVMVDFEMPDELYFENRNSLRSEIQASLNSGKHIIFTGPPGTGKTKLAKEICRQCTTDLSQIDGHTFTTATSEWTAFDTIGGYVPSTDTEASSDELTFQPRLFLNCFRRKNEGIMNNWLVIDEINRSNIDKAFGQLFSVLSGDSVELPYKRQNQVEIVSVKDDASDDELRDIAANPDVFPVTPSWRLLATMNTYDKASLYEMSYAFMRRFNFVHVGIPDLETDDGLIRTSLLDPANDDNYAAAWLEEEPSIESTLDEVYEEVVAIWHVVNSYSRAIGPSIVRDILGYVDAYGIDEYSNRSDEALTAAIVGMIYPQLEGLRPETQRDLVRAFAGEHETDQGTVTLTVDEERLKAKAADFFNIRFDNE